MYGRFYETQPVDVFIVNCPYRRKDNYCRNETENLSVTLIPKIKLLPPTKEEQLAWIATQRKLAALIQSAGVKR